MHDARLVRLGEAPGDLHGDPHRLVGPAGAFTRLSSLATSSPVRNSMTRYRPSLSSAPTSNTWTMCWLSTRLAARASWRKRCAMSFIPASDASISLMASRLPISRCSASQTTPIESGPDHTPHPVLAGDDGARKALLEGVVHHAGRLAEASSRRHFSTGGAAQLSGAACPHPDWRAGRRNRRPCWPAGTGRSGTRGRRAPGLGRPPGLAEGQRRGDHDAPLLARAHARERALQAADDVGAAQDDLARRAVLVRVVQDLPFARAAT